MLDFNLKVLNARINFKKNDLNYLCDTINVLK